MPRRPRQPAPPPDEQIAGLTTRLEAAEAKLKEVTRERDEALELVTEMRQQVEDVGTMIDNWVDVFELEKNGAGVWVFNRRQSDLWEAHGVVLAENRRLIREWNRLVPEYNAVIAPRTIGRPAAASAAQAREVKRRRRKGESLRAIAKATLLGVRVVRTILEAKEKRTTAMRRRVFDKARAAAYRVRVRQREAIPGEVTRLEKEGAQLVKRAKGLG
jgi:hypothetical protein